MRIWFLLVFIFLFFSCAQEWSESHLTELDRLSQNLKQNVDLSNQLTLSKFEFLVNQNGRRPADVEVLDQAKHVVQILEESQSLNGITDRISVKDKRFEDLGEILSGSNTIVSPLQKSQLIEKVVNYYAQMVGGNCICFDEPTVKLLRSTESSSQYRVIVGGSLPDRELSITQKNENVLEVIDPLLVKKEMTVDWELVESKKLIYEVPEY